MKPLHMAMVRKISETSLVSAMRLIQVVETPPYIPFFEVLTLDQLSKYFCVQLGLMQNLYRRNRDMFQSYMCRVHASEMEPYAMEVTDLGEYLHAKSLLFANGVKVSLSKTTQFVFDARGLLLFAVLICNHTSRIGDAKAEKLLTLLHNEIFEPTNPKPALKPWFTYEAQEQDTVLQCEQKIEILSPHLSDHKKLVAEHQVLEVDVKTEVKVSDATPKATSERGNANKRPVDRYSIDGRFLNRYDSETEASYETRVPVNAISRCCLDKQKTAGGYIWRFA